MENDFWNHVDWYGLVRGAVVEHKTRGRCIGGIAECGGEFRYVPAGEKPEPGVRFASFPRCPVCGKEAKGPQ